MWKSYKGKVSSGFHPHGHIGQCCGIVRIRTFIWVFLRKLQGIKHLDLSLLPSQAMVGNWVWSGAGSTLTSVQVECHFYRDGFSGYDTKCRAACQKLLTTVLRHMWKWDTRLSQEGYSREDWEHHLWHNEQTSLWVFFSGGRNTRGEHQEVKA